MIRSVTHPSLGVIKIKLLKNARYLTFKIAPDGTPTISAPHRTSMRTISSFLKQNESELQKHIAEHQSVHTYHDGAKIGLTHTLKHIVRPSVDSHHATLTKNLLVVVTPTAKAIDIPEVQTTIREKIILCLKKQAKQYLPARLEKLSQEIQISYSKVRLTHSQSRWGSCSSNGTISLNIALMTCTLEQIDYVIYHELAHRTHMNHSEDFWNLLKRYMPDSAIHRHTMKQKNSTI